MDVLTGAVTPSGKLTDTIAYAMEDYPSTKNYGNNSSSGLLIGIILIVFLFIFGSLFIEGCASCTMAGAGSSSYNSSYSDDDYDYDFDDYDYDYDYDFGDSDGFKYDFDY